MPDRNQSATGAAGITLDTAAELPLDDITHLVDELLEAHGDAIPPLSPAGS